MRQALEVGAVPRGALDNLEFATKGATVMTDSGTGKRQQALDRALQQIERAYGKGAIMQMDGNVSASHDGIPTGALSLDIALGGCGVPRGRVVEIFGPESSGKTTLALHIVASAQRLGGVAAFVDAEHASEPKFANYGINVYGPMFGIDVRLGKPHRHASD